MTNPKKIIAFYLPQFHQIPENDEWWGEGFTEWTNTKKAKPLFKNHRQPRVPFENNYYDLSSSKEMQLQAALAESYGVSGFCYYHYWFKGKKLLNKPLENMLQDKMVNIDFCLSWANEPWTRAWDGGNKEILMPQDYGDEKDWELHLEYLIPFFADPRYIKIEGRPVFLIYRTASFSMFDNMIAYWNDILISRGFSKLYIIETLNSFQTNPSCASSDGVLEFEPMFTISNDFSLLEKVFRVIKRKLIDRGLFVLDYNTVWKKIIARQGKASYDKKSLMAGAFVDWDSTPRKGYNGLVMKNGSTKAFEKYFRALYQKSDAPFIFINAWNEWAEGTYLEPDSENGFKYLMSIKDISQT